MNKTCSYMVPHMIFKYKLQRMFSRASLTGCHLHNVNDITHALLAVPLPLENHCFHLKYQPKYYSVSYLYINVNNLLGFSTLFISSTKAPSKINYVLSICSLVFRWRKCWKHSFASVLKIMRQRPWSCYSWSSFEESPI